MYTQQIKRTKGNVFMEMHTMGTSSNLGKLGSSLISSMQSLQSKKQQILKLKNISKLPSLIDDFKSQHRNFIQLQKSFFQIDQKTPQTQRLKGRIKQFLQNIKVEQVESKLQTLRQEKIRQNERLQIMDKVQKKTPTPGSQLIMDNKQLIRQNLLQEQLEELKMIEKLITDIKNIAIKTSSLIYEQGVNLNIAAQTIQTARQKFQDARSQLVQANQYQQDTNRKKLWMCLVIVIIVVIFMLIIIASSRKRQ